ncbi:hypothetical protein [Phytomonospora endophytica]|uniref:Uncharacterized protein n=1 Tax=Phytomonospora endophytica TaxID=714109 RepID=A0A841FRD3_9ACTN|nr:hypothetical protein [Phytomonospora endophytica]MBB6038374.1 hypothetical protein [Phytomonospora endophytica]GIG64305.1 hypothetical protein Pen01_06000 [Phytomonospora endophytica]
MSLRPERRGGPRRLGILTLVAALTVALVTVVGAPAASAACTPNPALADYYYNGGGGWWYGFKYISQDEHFIKSFGESYVNNTPNPIGYHYEESSTTTKVWTTTGTVSESLKRTFVTGLEFQSSVSLTRGYSYTVAETSKRTFDTAISPQTILYFDFGNLGYAIRYVFRVFYMSNCAVQGETGVETMIVPSNDKRWIFTAVPV